MKLARQSDQAGRIRNSTDDDMEKISQWLRQQDKAGVAGTFLCNWNLTLENHRRGRLLVYVESELEGPIAYQWGGLIHPGILEVRADKRGRGIGKRIVQHCVAKALEVKKSVLQIQCTPSTSIPFWRSMGFTLYDEAQGYAYRLLEFKHALPKNGVATTVELRFYPERRKWESDCLPLSVYTPTAVRVGNDIFLSERVCIFDDQDGSSDIVVGVFVDGEEIYLDKAKYKEANTLGVSTDDGEIFVDVIHLA